MDHWEETKSAGVWELVITASGDGDAGSWVLGDGRVCSEESEYGCTVHCNEGDSGPM